MSLPGASSTGWLLALAAAIAYALGALVATRPGGARSLSAMAPAWALHAAALAQGLMGSAAHFGFAPALSMTAWLVLTAYAVEYQLFPQMRARAALGPWARWRCCWRRCFRGGRCMSRPLPGWRCI